MDTVVVQFELGDEDSGPIGLVFQTDVPEADTFKLCKVTQGSASGILQAGDALVSINGKEILPEQTLSDIVWILKATRPLSLLFMREQRGNLMPSGRREVAVRPASESFGGASGSTSRPRAVEPPEPSRVTGRPQQVLMNEGDSLDLRKAEILAWIAQHDVCFIEAATGMGKSTRIPQFVMDQDPSHLVWQLQPRRLAAKRLAEYVGRQRAEEGWGVSEEVGYRVRGDQRVAEQSRLVYMTTGYFLHFVLHHLHRLRDMHRAEGVEAHRQWCTHLFIDEVHEASEEIELLLLLVRMLGAHGTLPFKVVIMSATLDFDTLHDYFVKDIVAVPAAEAAAQQHAQGALAATAEGLDDRAARTIELALERGDKVPLGLQFGPSDTVDGQHCGGWVVARVRKRSPGYGRLRAGDCLKQINGRPLEEFTESDISLLLRRRPLLLRFMRAATEQMSVAHTVMQLSVRTPFPVEILYLDDIEEQISGWGYQLNFNDLQHRRGRGPDKEVLDLCARLVIEACCSVEDSALVFLPGIAEIEYFCQVLDRKMKELKPGCGSFIDVVILHSITLAENCEVRRPEHPTRPTAYIASSIAETSITLPELSTVLDFGFSRGTRYIPQLEMEQLETRMGSSTSARQRVGRVGRTKPGRAYRLYPKSIWEEMPANDSWGPGGVQRSLESTVLLVTKTLVPYLGMTLEECLGLLVRAPSEDEASGAIQRLEELDALSIATAGNPQLTAFGEFATCIAVLGPRMARLVYCGLLYNCVRTTIVLSAIHSVCGKGDLFAGAQDHRQAAKDEEAEETDRFELMMHTLEDKGSVGLVFHPPTFGSDWTVSKVNAGSWAETVDLKENDQLHEVNGFAIENMTQPQAKHELFKRPVTLGILRKVEEPKAAAKEAALWSPQMLRQMVNVAKWSLENDGGHMSEPVTCMALFEKFLVRKLRSDVCSLHKMRQIDGICREIGSKLRSLARHTEPPHPRSGLRSARQRVLHKLMEDRVFACSDFERPLSDAMSSGGDHFLWQCFKQQKLADLHLVLSAAFPNNFLFAALDPPPKSAAPKEGNEANGASSAGAVAAPPPFPPDEQAKGERGAEAPPITLRGAPPSLAPEIIAQKIAVTFQIPRPQLDRVEDQPPGNYTVQFQGQAQHAPNLTHPVFICKLTEAALVNMVVQRDSRQRLQLFLDSDKVQSCGELHVVPVFKWRLLRAPSLMIKAPPRVTPLLRSGPVQGIGPECPIAGPGAQGFRLAISMELEATKLQQKQGKHFRSGKAIQSWRTSWLPNQSAFDLALLLTFWIRGMTLHDVVSPCDQTAYSAISVGLGITIHFPEDAPLLDVHFQELRAMYSSVRQVHCSGLLCSSSLPTVHRLREWGARHLSEARVVTEIDFQIGATASASLAAGQYSHRIGHGRVSLSSAPARVLQTAFSVAPDPSSVGASGVAGVEELPSPPWCFSRRPRCRNKMPQARRLTSGDAPLWAQAWCSARDSAVSCAASSSVVPSSGEQPPAWSVDCVVRYPVGQERSRAIS